MYSSDGNVDRKITNSQSPQAREIDNICEYIDDKAILNDIKIVKNVRSNGELIITV